MAVFDHGASWNCSSNGLSVKIECEEKLGLWCTTSYVDGGGEGTGFGESVFSYIEILDNFRLKSLKVEIDSGGGSA